MAANTDGSGGDKAVSRTTDNAATLGAGSSSSAEQAALDDERIDTELDMYEQQIKKWKGKQRSESAASASNNTSWNTQSETTDMTSTNEDERERNRIIQELEHLERNQQRRRARQAAYLESRAGTSRRRGSNERTELDVYDQLLNGRYSRNPSNRTTDRTSTSAPATGLSAAPSQRDEFTELDAYTALDRQGGQRMTNDAYLAASPATSLFSQPSRQSQRYPVRHSSATIPDSLHPPRGSSLQYQSRQLHNTGSAAQLARAGTSSSFTGTSSMPHPTGRRRRESGPPTTTLASSSQSQMSPAFISASSQSEGFGSTSVSQSNPNAAARRMTGRRHSSNMFSAREGMPSGFIQRLRDTREDEARREGTRASGGRGDTFGGSDGNSAGDRIRGDESGAGERAGEIRLPPWQPDEEVTSCPICHTIFGFFVRKHHCRKCGRVVCASCSPHRITLPNAFIVCPPGDASQSLLDESGGTKVRLCNPCVPDPQLPPPPSYQTAMGNEQSRRDEQRLGTGIDRMIRNERGLYTNRPQPNPPLAHPHPNRAGAPGGLNAFPPPPRPNPQPHYRSLLDPSPATPRPHLRLTEADYCAVCNAPLPARTLPNFESERAVHVNNCINRRMAANAAQNAASSTSQRPQNDLTSEMAVYDASEKDTTDSEGNDVECLICFEEIEIGAKMARLKCLCTFHRDCIVDWLGRGRGRCPTHGVLEGQ